MVTRGHDLEFAVHWGQRHFCNLNDGAAFIAAPEAFSVETTNIMGTRQIRTADVLVKRGAKAINTRSGALLEIPDGTFVIELTGTLPS